MEAKSAFLRGCLGVPVGNRKKIWQLLRRAELSSRDIWSWTEGREQPSPYWALSTESHSGPQAAQDESSESSTAAARLNPLS